MKRPTSRRSFLRAAAASATALALQPGTYARALGSNDRISIGVIGCGQRGYERHMNGVHEHSEKENVEITAHNVRDDHFVSDVVTAVDVILTLADMGEISYELKWYEHIGNAIVKNYYVERINDDAHSGMCGFVYEIGETGERSGNHIHITPDLRVMQSPEYVLFFWIELGPC